MPVVKVDRRNLGNALKAHMRARQRDLEAAALETCHRGVAEAVRLTDEEDLVDLGAYKAGFRVARGATGPELRNDTPYAAVIEWGRRPNRPGPPVSPIREWVRRKLGLEGAELERVAWKIREAIHRKGTRPRFIMTRVQKSMRGWFREAVGRRLRTPVR